MTMGHQKILKQVKTPFRVTQEKIYNKNSIKKYSTDNSCWTNDNFERDDKMESDFYEFYKEDSKEKIWKVTHYILIDKDKGFETGNVDVIIGEILFSFDKKKIYNLWIDYPHNLTKEEKELFDKENPHWVDFFKGRC